MAAFENGKIRLECVSCHGRGKVIIYPQIPQSPEGYYIPESTNSGWSLKEEKCQVCDGYGRLHE